MIRNILASTDKRLRIKSKPVTKIDKKILSIIKDLKDTLNAQKDPEGIGLAAPQISKNVKVFIIKPDKVMKVIINPEVLDISEDPIDVGSEKQNPSRKNIMEGCLSLPHYYGPIKRARKIKIRYLNEKGELKIETFKGLEAQIVQHEIDHLNGILFIDRLLEQKKPLYEYVNGKWEEVEI